jgi:hypothetical protein
MLFDDGDAASFSATAASVLSRSLAVLPRFSVVANSACEETFDTLLSGSSASAIDAGKTASGCCRLAAWLGGAVMPTPPFVDSPSLALAATQFLYVDNGNRSFISLIAINFFPNLGRCGLADIFSRLIGSASSPFRRARLRARYRNPCRSPTIILEMHQVSYCRSLFMPACLQ